MAQNPEQVSTGLRSAFLIFGSKVVPTPITFLRPFPSISVHSVFLVATTEVRIFPSGSCLWTEGWRQSRQILLNTLQWPGKLPPSTPKQAFILQACFVSLGNITCSVMPCLKDEISSSASWRPGEIFCKAPVFSCLLYFYVLLEICWRGMRMSICTSADGLRVLLTLTAIISTRATMREIKLVIQRG